jgi:hypothetical protein
MRKFNYSLEFLDLEDQKIRTLTNVHTDVFADVIEWFGTFIAQNKDRKFFLDSCIVTEWGYEPIPSVKSVPAGEFAKCILRIAEEGGRWNKIKL